MTQHAALAWAVLSQEHYGRGRAIRQEALCIKLGPPFIDGEGRAQTRLLQEVLKDLAETDGLLVVSSCRAPMGVYVPTTLGEIDEYKAQLGARMASLGSRLRAASLAESALRAGLRQSVLF